MLCSSPGRNCGPWLWSQGWGRWHVLAVTPCSRSWGSVAGGTAASGRLGSSLRAEPILWADTLLVRAQHLRGPRARWSPYPRSRGWVEGRHPVFSSALRPATGSWGWGCPDPPVGCSAFRFSCFKVRAARGPERVCGPTARGRAPAEGPALAHFPCQRGRSGSAATNIPPPAPVSGQFHQFSRDSELGWVSVGNR